MVLFDTHAHLLDEQFEDCRNALISALPAASIGYVVEAGCDLDDIARIRALTVLYDHVYGAVGVHPENAGSFNPRVARRMSEALNDRKIVAVGEIGLDYHSTDLPRELQRDVLAAQLDIAENAHKPVIIHDRDAHGDTMELLRARKGRLTGVLHCYSGSYEDALTYIDMGYYIAFGGALTFRNATKQREMAQKLPIDRLLLETDCPYMTPEPHRGERNDPTNLCFTLDVLARTRGMEPTEVADITTENAKRLFGIA